MRSKLKAWFRGLFGGAISGGASAVLASLGFAGAASIGLEVKPLDATQIAGVFVSGAIIKALVFLVKDPLPPENGDAAAK